MNTDDHLYSIVLLLTPTHAATVRATMGHHAHAAFLDTVRQADPALAEVLHMPQLPLRPFTVSPLLGLPDDARESKGQLALTPGQEIWLRFTVLYPPIFEQFMNRFLYGARRPTLRLGRAEFLIQEILATPGSHPWAGYTTWAELVNGARPAREVTLEFASPTAFNFGQRTWGKQIVVLPEPRLVLGSLARTWNQIAPPEVHVDKQSLREYLDEHAVVTRIEGLQTRMLRFAKAPQIGFTGRVSYGWMGDDDAARAQLDALAGLAFYTGVGLKTAMGMGQCRRRTTDDRPTT